MFQSYWVLRITLFSSLLLLCPAATLKVNAAGELDTAFSAAAIGPTSGTVNVVKQQSDGKILVGGYFSTANSTAASGLIRLNSDGSVDATFNTQNLFSSLGIGASVSAIAVQSDGKILIAGYFYTPAGVAQPGVRRLNADGSLDPAFNPLFVNPGSAIFDIEIQSDGSILIGGNFSGPSLPENVLRMSSNGTVDPAFVSQPGVAVKDLETQPDGKIIIVGHLTTSDTTGIVKRLTSNGTVDATFVSPTINNKVEVVKVRPSGQYLIGGAFNIVNGFTLSRLALVNFNGSLDLTFNQGGAGVQAALARTVLDIEPTPDGKLMIGGYFSSYNFTDRRSLARLNANGSLDSSFNANSFIGDSAVLDLEVLPSGRVITGLQNTSLRTGVAAFDVDGLADPAFSVLLGLDGQVRKMVQQPDGKILIGGSFRFVNGVLRNGLARLHADGTLDLTFVPFFNTNDPRIVMAIAVQPDGKIILGFSSPFFRPIRLHPDGTQDPNFVETSGATITHDIAVLPNGQALIGGPGYGIRRVDSNGNIDNTFIASTLGVNKIVVQPDGQILIGGTFTQVGPQNTPRGRIARLNGTNGSLDPSFNPPGGANGPVEDFDLQLDGKIILGGDFTGLNGAPRLRLGRLNSDGSLDESFVQSADGPVRAVKLQSDGKVLVGGSFGFIQGELRVGVVRLNTNGAIDSSFIARPNTSVYDVILQPDNKVLICGEFTIVNGFSAVRVARLLNPRVPATTLFDYDGDGKADVSVFRSSENKWYIFRSSDSVVYQPTFALPGDQPVPADYDGDGKTDVAIFRPASGDWWYLASSDGSQRSTHWGASGDIPRPSDFDGDGKADFIVFRPSENNWYRLGSTGVVSIVNFGLAGDKAVTGDFDGDGKSDLAIYRPSTGVWWYRSSVSGAFIAINFGIQTDTPAPADFDGDGKTDLAVYRASTGVWYILNSGTGQPTIVNFGISEDKPVPADYDGDGRADIAVFRPSTGVWYQLRSTAGFSAMQFGVSSDVPTPNSFVP